jgi:hypothetical protein
MPSVRGKIDLPFLMLKSSSPLGLRRLRKTVYFAPVLLLIAVVSVSGVPFAHAQSLGGWSSNGWVTSGSVYDLTGNANLTQGQALVTGHDYNMTLKVTVPNTSTSTPQFQVSINTLLQPAKDYQSTIWALHSSAYPGYNRTSFNPGLKTVTFNYVQGTLRLSAYFKVPGNFTIPLAKYSTPSGNGTITLHLPQNGVIFVSIVPVGSTSTGYFSAPVQDQTIQAYLNQYNQTASLVPSGKIPSVYSSLVDPILNESQALNKLGLPDQGKTLLDALIPSAFPTPPNSSLQTYLLIGLAVAVILVVLLAVMMMRSRGRSGYSSSLIGEVQKDLAVLEVTAAKYDRAMADKLKSLRAKLSDTS